MQLRWIVLFVALTTSHLIHGQTLSGQVFILSEQYDENKCEVVALCDCCATDLFFINKKEFVMVSRCLFDNTFSKGKYRIKNNLLTLKYNKIHISEKTDEQTGKVTHVVEKSNIEKSDFEINTCGKKLRLHHTAIPEFKNGMQYEQSKEKQLKSELLKSKAWKLLGKKQS
ncbi:MAG: hypothetical protein ACK5RG_17845 [Cyclobacteriaceae bacterium]|jgi:hypothetical protein|nr:hypothetical protein [Flammeovirgaceae bacterium]